MRKLWERIEQRFGGHFSVGPVTIYGANAMHWGVNIHTKRWGYVCFRLPLPCFGHWWPLYFYVSPNATPWAATFTMGWGEYGAGKREAKLRLAAFGHNFDTTAYYPALRAINDGWPQPVEAQQPAGEEV